MELNDLLQKKLGKEELSSAESFALLEAKEKAVSYLNYKREEELSLAIKIIIVNMAIDIMAIDSAKSEDALKSITMGDTAYSFDTQLKAGLASEALKKHEDELRRFRRLRK